jgi:hypothetical protein
MGIQRTIAFLFRKDSETVEHDSLSSAISAFYNNQCQDPKDHVYGVRGLIPKNARDQIVVDYAQSDEVAFFDAVRVMIHEQPGLGRITIASGIDGLGRLMFPKRLDVGDGWDFRGYFLSNRWKKGMTFLSEAEESEFLLRKIKEYLEKGLIEGPGVYLDDAFKQLVR